MKKTRTNITVTNPELWAWAFGRAKQLGEKSVSTYLFQLIQKDKKQLEDALPH